MLFGIWAFGSFLLAIFPTDGSSIPLTLHGFTHLITAIVSFLGRGMKAYFLTRSLTLNLYSRNAMNAFSTLSGLIILLLLIGLILTIGLPYFAARVGGLTERLFLGSLLLWMFIVSYSTYQSKPKGQNELNMVHSWFLESNFYHSIRLKTWKRTGDLYLEKTSLTS